MFGPFVLVLAIPCAAVAALARWAAAWALGMRGVGLFFNGAIESPEAAAPWRRALVVLASVAASYLVAGVPFATALLADGRIVSTTEVRVLPGSPAAAAGMESGDRVLSVGGARIATWPEIAAAVREHAGEPLEVVVVRGGDEKRVTVTPQRGPDGRGKIGVQSVEAHEPVGLVTALGAGVTMPMQVLAGVARGAADVAAGKVAGELAGPVGIVREAATAERRGVGPMLQLIGGLTAYAWPVSAVLAVVFVPRRARSKPPRPT
jgi:regulator of sigma E protease